MILSIVIGIVLLVIVIAVMWKVRNLKERKKTSLCLGQVTKNGVSCLCPYLLFFKSSNIFVVFLIKDVKMMIKPFPSLLHEN